MVLNQIVENESFGIAFFFFRKKNYNLKTQKKSVIFENVQF
jgi:hypothetical protein